MQNHIRARISLLVGLFAAALVIHSTPSSAQTVTVDNSGKIRATFKPRDLTHLEPDQSAELAMSGVWLRTAVSAKLDKATGQVTAWRCGYKRGNDKMQRTVANPEQCPVTVQ